MTSPRPRRRPLPDAATATLASFNVLGLTHSLNSLARWRPHGLVGGHYPAPRRPSSPRSTRSARLTCSVRSLVGTRLTQLARLDLLARLAYTLASSRPRRHPRRLDGLTPLGLHHPLAGTSRASWAVELRLHDGPIRLVLRHVGCNRGRRRWSNSDPAAAHLDEFLFNSLDTPTTS